ncbi:uncharacterized protein ALTATR162_LOCUS653 [Alternaria atra]|uniref:Heterokaryon incompatibility domain-containing protein n=1 Tax=Alternaria atra TaxID=119953 RepID=A0A8J2HUG3_9PLEO|nr:uncharacterized protein ALTATR162_LOCUS653 [Alternaria atra]CAG5140183.1 unnamed protein product [Alternaria atra]
MSHYTYAPLADSQIRFLRVRRHPATLQLLCNLEPAIVPFGEGYTALSYTWGDLAPTHSVLIEGRIHSVPQNLFDFFQAFVAHPWGSSSIQNMWVDQLCINQFDLAERSKQVGMMNKIFRSASKVLVWLGCDSAMVEAARRLRYDVGDSNDAIATLLRHPYFSRVWVVQEIALARARVVVCGDVELAWSDLLNAVARHFDTLNRIPAVINETEHYRTLEMCLYKYCWNDCHDPRDKLYGLLGLTAERWRINVNYDKPLLEVYLDAVCAVCEELFDIWDPNCFYDGYIEYPVNLESYRTTLLALGVAMGLPKRQLMGLRPFIEAIQTIYHSTLLRNVRFIFTGLLYSKEREQDCAYEATDPKVRITVRWDSVAATRRNPFLRDVIPRMGLQEASGSLQGSEGSGSNEDGPAWDRWWFEHNGRIRYFPCLHTDEFAPSTSAYLWDVPSWAIA